LHKNLTHKLRKLIIQHFKVILDASQTNFTLRNLKSSTEYIIGIRAKTQAGDGQLKLTQIKSGVPPELPEPPKAIVLRTIGHTWIELEFIPGYNGKTSINKWIVEALVLNNVESKSDYSNANLYTWRKVYEKANAPNATKLTVENLLPFTNYTLRMYARNVKGISKPSLPTDKFQTLADVPSQTPAYLSARLGTLYKNTTKNNNINVWLKWTPIPSSKWNGVPLGYVLFINECSSANQSARIEIKFNKMENTKYLVKNLDSFKCYMIRIGAWNNVGVGPLTSNDSLVVLNRTSQSKPSRGPFNVNLYSINSSSIRVIWSRLDEQHANGILIGYKLKYQPDLASSSLPSNNLSLLLGKVERGYNYFNQYESAEYEGDNDLSYLISYKPKDFYVSLSKKNYNQLQYELVLNNLLSSTNYKIEIAACTKAGCGQFSLPVSLRTSEFLASRPVDLRFTYVNLTSVQLEWKPPRYPNGVIKSYRIR
jgi:protein sidekick